MRAASRPIAASVQKRLYATRLAEHQEASRVSLPKQSAQITRLNNGALVTSLENYAPIAHISILFKAGTRNESYENLGVCHALRTGAALSTQNVTQFGLTRNLQQLGADLTCTTTREHVCYSLQADRDKLTQAFQFLGEAAFMQNFKRWEVKDRVPDYLNLDLGRLDLDYNTRVIELLHTAAYRRTLANSLYIDRNRISGINHEMMTSYAKDMFTAGDLIVSGVGVDHKDLVKLTQSMNVTGTAKKPQEAVFYGGEQRVDIPGEFTFAALATKSSSIGDKEYFATLVLQRILGVGPHMKYSNTGKLQDAASKAAKSPVQVSSMNLVYSDSGLFGVQAVAKSADIASVLKATTEQIGQVASGSVSAEALETAKRSVKSTMWMELESSAGLVQDLALQAAYRGALMEPAEFGKAIDEVDASAVKNVAAQIFKGKPAFAAVGNLSQVPYLDELKL
ncbi:DgyrCDS7275 [Dimorphilus gyrociliatus]|uniref:DgyrCDS7275 n=1 Tax=Dimorphilus gyrociliatus TaxID=2664684 RepID=A0A7I8VT69_9ANNE|nr:DgyrCDS7275 [Dimorphilus gyrociliatus]